VASIRQLSQEVGVEAANLLDSLARSAADEQEAADAREAALAGPRSTARVLTFLPLLGLGIGCAIGARPWEVAVDGGVGTAIVLLGVLLMLAGRTWTNALLRRASAVDRDRLDSLLTLELLAAALGSGLPIPIALTEVGRLGSGPIAPCLEAAGSRLAQGEPWEDAWSQAHSARADSAITARRPGGGAVGRANSIRAGRFAGSAMGGSSPAATGRPASNATSRGNLTAGRRLGGGAARGSVFVSASRSTNAAPGGVAAGAARPTGRATTSDDLLEATHRALRWAWDAGVAAAPLLTGAAIRERRAARRQANVAAGQLGIRLMLPLGLCFLPAFVALGLAPVVLSLVSGLNFFP